MSVRNYIWFVLIFFIRTFQTLISNFFKIFVYLFINIYVVLNLQILKILRFIDTILRLINFLINLNPLSMGTLNFFFFLIFLIDQIKTYF